MKPDLFTAVMKTIGSTQDENIRTAIDSALDTLNEKANQNAEATRLRHSARPNPRTRKIC